MGHQTHVVHDGLAAVEAADVFRPDLVVLDLDMPRLDGYEAARQIRGRAWASDVYLVALTGWGEEANRERTEQAGFHEHLVKPVEPDELNEMLAQVGRSRRGR